MEMPSPVCHHWRWLAAIGWVCVAFSDGDTLTGMSSLAVASSDWIGVCVAFSDGDALTGMSSLAVASSDWMGVCSVQ